MKRTAILALLLIAACETETDRELASLRAELTHQQEKITRLSAFVDAQAKVLTICQTVMVEFTDYLMNTNAIGMFREAGNQYDRFGECTEAISAFNVAAAERSTATASTRK
jgi:uncharacterized coiled-coil protein SlyX